MSGGQQLQQPDSVEGINMGTDRAFPSQAWQDKEKSIPPPVPEPEYPSRLGLGLIALGLCLAVFLFALDQTIVANAIPTITDEFGSVSDIGWYGSAFLVTTASLQLFYGVAYSYFSIKFIFLSAVGIFELGSLVCALAPTSTALIIGRAVAGLGGSGIVAGGLIIVAHSAPLRMRPVFLGAIGGMFGIASVSGPLLGGVFTDRLTWRWCFYINLPFGAVTVLAISLFFKSPRRPAVDGMSILARAERIDWIGIILLIPAVVCLLLALQWGGAVYPWSNARVIALFVLSGLLAVAFGALQYRKGDKAIVPPRIITQRSIAAAAWYAFFNGAAFFALIYYTPLWHQVIRQASAVDSGIRLLPMIVGMVVMVMLSGGLVTVFGYYTPFMLLSSTLAPIGAGLLSTLTVDATFAQWFGFEALSGLAIGMGMQQPMMAVQTVLAIDDVPIASSLIIFMQTLGAAVFVAVAQAVFGNRLRDNLQGLFAETMDAGSGSGSGSGNDGVNPAELLRVGATDISDMVTPPLRRPVLEACNDAITRVFVVSVCASSLTILGSLVMEWKSVKKSGDMKAQGNGDGDGVHSAGQLQVGI